MLRICLFAPFEVELDGGRLELPRNRKARSLLGWLALHPGPQPRSRLAARFWPDVLDSSARASLRSAIWALRNALGREGAAVLEADRETVGLRGDGIWVDALEFSRLARAGQLEAAMALCRGELLHEFDDEWAFELRDEHSRLLGEVLAGLALEADRRGEHRQAIEWSRRRAALDPLDETAIRELIGRLADSGERAAALSVYTRLVERLREELGIPPSRETERLVAELRIESPNEPVAAARNPTAPARGLVGLAPLLGRRDELRMLLEAFRRTRAGIGTVATIAGEGGMGKTRIARELIDAVSGQGAVASTGAVEPGNHSPLPPWPELLSDALAAFPELALDPSLRRELARIVPAVRDGPGEPAGTLAADPELARVRMSEAVVDLLTRLSERCPLILVLEDIHLADASSIALLGHVGRRIHQARILLLVTRRLLPERPDVDAQLDLLRSRGTLGAELELGSLEPVSTRELVSSVADLTAEQLERVVSLSEGNPLLAIEFARAHEREADVAVAGLGAAVRPQLMRLSSDARHLIELVAALGRDLKRGELLSLPFEDPGAVASEALGSGLLNADGGAIGLRHALLGEAVYEQVPQPRRADLHRDLAELLRRPAGTRGGSPAEIARHLRSAGEEERAGEQFARAAAEARAVAALPEAASLLTEAIELLPGEPELLVELAEVEAWRGTFEASERAFERALTAIPTDDSGGLVGAWLRRGRWLRGGVCHPHESRRSYLSAIDVLDRDPGTQLGARAEALAGLAWAEATAGDPERAERLLIEVGEIYDKRPVDDLLTHDVSIARAHVLLRRGRFTESYAPLVAAAAAAGRAGRPDMAYTCLANGASAATAAGELDRALEFAERCRALVAPNGLLRLAVYAESARAGILRRLRRFDEAAAACKEGAAIAERLGAEELEGLVAYDSGLVSLELGEPESAASELDRALALGAPVSRPLARLLRAEALVLSGAADEGERELRATALEPVGPGDFPQALVPRMSFVEGLIARARGERENSQWRFQEAAEGWVRCAGAQAPGEDYVSALVDLGRPPTTVLIEPERELERVEGEIARVGGQLAVTAEKGQR